MSGVKFSPGSVYITPGAQVQFTASGDDPLAFLIRHLAGDWGEVNAEDWQANEQSLLRDLRLLSVYTMRTVRSSGSSRKRTGARPRSYYPMNTESSGSPSLVTVLVFTMKPRGLPYESLAGTSTAHSRRVQASTSPLAQRLYPTSEAGRYCVSGLETSVAASALLLRRFLE
jgi:hypothetical protein